VAEYNEENTRGGKTGVAVRKAINSDAYRGLSGAMLGSAYRSFGKAFDGGGYTPRGMRPDTSYLDNWTEAGSKAQKALEDRWHKSEFSNFRKNHLDKFQAEMQEIEKTSSFLTQELQEGRWPTSDGQVELLDYNIPEQRTKAARLRNHVQSEAIRRITDLQVNLNNVAAEKYSKNPIIDLMIQQMMEHQTQAMAAQFQTPRPMQQAKDQMGLDTGRADIKYKQALTRQADAQTSRTEGKYKSTDSVMRDMGPAQAARYFANNVEGKALLEQTEFPGFMEKLTQQTADEYIKRQKWDQAEAMHGPNQEATQNFVQSELPRIRQRATYEWMKQEYGQDAAEAAAADRPGMLEGTAAPFKYDVTTNPTKKETKEKTDRWDALGVAKANEQMARDPGMSKKEAKDWLMDEWLPKALDGTDIAEGGAYLKQFDGLTAEEANKAAAPYIAAVRKALEKASKWLGSGAGTEGLLPEQKSQPAGTPRRGRGGLGRLVKGLYPPDFRKQFPQGDEDTKD
jgi:hypothetical protein